MMTMKERIRRIWWTQSSSFFLPPIIFSYTKVANGHSNGEMGGCFANATVENWATLIFVLWKVQWTVLGDLLCCLLISFVSSVNFIFFGNERTTTTINDFGRSQPEKRIDRQLLFRSQSKIKRSSQTKMCVCSIVVKSDLI